MTKSIRPKDNEPSFSGSDSKTSGYVLKLGPIAAITKFSKKIETPIAEIMKYKTVLFFF